MMSNSIDIKSYLPRVCFQNKARVGAKIRNGIPPELRKLRKTPFKRKLTHLLLKILETEEMNVDLRYIDLSSLYYFCTD